LFFVLLLALFSQQAGTKAVIVRLDRAAALRLGAHVARLHNFRGGVRFGVGCDRCGLPWFDKSGARNRRGDTVTVAGLAPVFGKQARRTVLLESQP
jgi:hypothetical protein